MSKTWGFFLVAQDMVLSHRAKFQLITNFFRVCMYFVVFLPNYTPGCLIHLILRYIFQHKFHEHQFCQVWGNSTHATPYSFSYWERKYGTLRCQRQQVANVLT